MFSVVLLLGIVGILCFLLMLGSNRSSNNNRPVVGFEPVDFDETADDSKPCVQIGLYCMPDGDAVYSPQKLSSFLNDKRLEYNSTRKVYEFFSDIGELVFTVASASEPGELDLSEEADVNGLVVVMSSDCLSKPAQGFDQVLMFLHELSTVLGGRLLDVTRQPLSQALCHSYREQLLACEVRGNA